MGLIVPEGVELMTDVSAGNWVVEALWPWGREGVSVGSVVPEGFDAYVRFPNERDLHGMASPGSLSRGSLMQLVEVLLPCTETPGRCWFGVWAGYGHLEGAGMSYLVLPSKSRLRRWRMKRQMLREADRRDEEGRRVLSRIPQVRTRGREYILFMGPVAAAALEFEGLYQSPNLWWPDDRAWCVATEIDARWTYVGGSARCIEGIMGASGSEAITTHLHERIGSHLA